MTLVPLGRLATLFALLISVVAPIALVEAAFALQEPEPGGIEIVLTSPNGSVGGACYDVTDALGGFHQVCDDDGDGVALLDDLPPGYVAIEQTSGPAGYVNDASGESSVPAGDIQRVSLST